MQHYKINGKMISKSEEHSKKSIKDSIYGDIEKADLSRYKNLLYPIIIEYNKLTKEEYLIVIKKLFDLNINASNDKELFSSFTKWIMLAKSIHYQDNFKIISNGTRFENSYQQLLNEIKNNNSILLIMYKNLILNKYINLSIATLTKEELKKICENYCCETEYNIESMLYELSNIDKLPGITKFFINNSTINLDQEFEKNFKQYYDKSRVHLCFDCPEEAWKDCPKVRDRIKHSLADYDFIIEGSQVIKNKELKQFIVSKCSRYDEAQKRLCK